MEDTLTDWQNEPSLDELKKDLTAAKPYHDKMVSLIQDWNDLKNVEGKYKPKEAKARSTIQPKLIRKQAEWRYSALAEPFLADRDIFKVSPNTAADVQAAAQSESVLNYQFREKIDRDSFINEAVRAVCDDGVCFVRTEWKRKADTHKEIEPVYQYVESNDPNLQQAIQLYQAEPKQALDTLDPILLESVKASIKMQKLVMAMPIGQQEIEKEDIKENAPKLTVLNPMNFYFDPSCNGSLENALFAIVSFETNKADLLEQGIYKNVDQIDWDNESTQTSDTYQSATSPDFSFKDTSRKKAIAYEYWGFYDVDNSGKLTPIVATWVNNTLIRLEENPFPDKEIPFVSFTYMPKRYSVYGEPDAELLADNQKIVGAATRTIVDLMAKSAASQTGTAIGFLDPINQDRYNRGEDYNFNTSIPPQAGIYQHTFPEISSSAFTLVESQLNEAESITGVKSFSGGISGDSYGAVAAGIRGALDAASKREMNILRRIVGGLAKLGKKILAMDAVFLSDDEVIRATNKTFVTINKDDLKGNYDIVIDISTPEADSAKAQDLAFMLQTIGNNIDPQLTVYILSQIAYLKHLPDLADKLANWQPPQPDESQQQMQQLQLQNQQLQNALLQAQIQQIQTQSHFNSAKADSLDVATHNTVTGVAHTQKVQEQQAQAAGNMKLKLMDGLLKPQKPDETPPNIAAGLGFLQTQQGE